MSENDAKTWNMLCHLSALVGFIIPFGNIIGPLIIWQMKKNEFPSVDAHGKEAVNFQIFATVVLTAATIITVILMFLFIGFLLVPVLGAAYIAVLVLSVIAGIKASNGEFYQYPFVLFKVIP
jgi:uncharacterized Tic20 family protein